MGNEHLGEGSSCGDEGRPMKKARYSWQVKGRARSQNSENCFENKSSSENTPTEENVNSAYPRYFSKSSDVERISEPDFMGSCNAGRADSCYTGRSLACITDRSSNFDQVPTLRASACIADRMDRGLARWQARQVAKGFVDNTINRVLDSWLTAPLPGNGGTLGVEDAAILMAISAHGLQNGAQPQVRPQSVPVPDLRDYQQPSGSGRSQRTTQAPSNSNSGEHFDFLEAAVAVAIQKKGLTPLRSTLPPSGQS